MNPDKLSKLYKEGKISTLEYLGFLLFECDEVGKRYFDLIFYQETMQEVPAPTGELIVWQDGRRAVWRDIKRTLMKVYDLLESKDDRGN